MSTKKLTVLYGSQTGTAQEVAERIWREGKRYSFEGPVLAMDEYQIPDLIHEPVVIFVCSTTGQGTQPDNMKRFWKFLLKKNLPLNSLKNVRFSVLGLGDSSYVKFNHAAKKLYKRVLQLGGQPIIDPAYADDQHDLGADAVVDPWISKLWNSLGDPLVEQNSRVVDPPRWIINVSRNDVAVPSNEVKKEELLKSNSAKVTCISNVRLTPEDHFQETRLIKFTSENLQYVPGDVFMIKPQNCDKSVDTFFEIFNDRRNEISENCLVRVTKRFTDMAVPYALQEPVTFRSIVKEYFDLNMIPRRYTFEILSHFTDSELEREKLIEFNTAEGQQELYNYCNRPKRTILEVLADFPHAVAKIPVEYLFEVFLPIRPRAFSIASAPEVHKNEIHILVAVVRYKTNLKKPRIGLCSTWLASLQSGSVNPAYIRSGSFIFPKQIDIPVIMVGPGTGIAPFRSYVHHSSALNPTSDRVVFFGCRNKTADYYFHEEWTSLQENHKVRIFTAFSRDQSEKIYVQHVIEKNVQDIVKLVAQQNAYIFVAGNSKNMPEAVKSAFISGYSKYENVEQDYVEQLFEKMELNGRYQTETWS